MDLQLEEELCERNKKLEVINEHLRLDLEAAVEIQETLLPKQLPDIPEVDFAWTFKPCAELAGDILNIFQLDDRHV